MYPGGRAQVGDELRSMAACTRLSRDKGGVEQPSLAVALDLRLNGTVQATETKFARLSAEFGNRGARISGGHGHAVTKMPGGTPRS